MVKPKQVPPSDLESEKCVLGSVIEDPNAIALASERISDEDFHISKHQLIFRAMLKLFQKGQSIDLITLRSVLTDQGEIDDIGGLSYLMELSEYGEYAPNISSYIRIVREKSVLRKIISSCISAQAAAYSQARPPKEILEDAERSFYGLSLGSKSDEPALIRDVISTIVASHLMPSKNAFDATISTKYYELDQMTTGFHPGELIIIAGRPSMGKTSLMLSMAANIVSGENPKPVAIFSLEMSREQCAGNILCGLARVPVQLLRERRGVPKDKRDILLEASYRLAECPLIIDDSVALSPAQLRSRARRLKKQHNIGAIFVDYLQLMRGDSRADNRQQEVSEISRGLKLLAKELKIPVIAGSQISRGAEASKDNRPKLSHLRESGAIEQDADLVLMLFREDYYNKESAKKGITEIIIGKQRNGPTGSFELRFFGQFTRFENLSSREH